MSDNHAHTTPEQTIESDKYLHPVFAVLWVIVGFLGATIAAQLVITFYTSLQHMSLEAAQTWLENNTSAQFVYTLLAYGLLVVPIVWMVYKRGLKLRDIGLVRPRFRDAGWALLLLPAYFFSYAILLTLMTVFITGLDVMQK